MKDSKQESIRIPCNLLQQNCFLRDCCPDVVNVQSSSCQKTYISLDEVVSDNGVELKETVQDYPYTPEYVNSFVDSADYHNDPIQAIASAQTSYRSNLGDITDLQNVSSLDLAGVKSIYEQLKKVFSEPVSSPESPPSSAPNPSDK